MSPIVSPKKQLKSCHATRRKLGIMVDKMKSFNYKNAKITAYLEIKELDHFSIVRNGNFQFPCEIRRSHVFPGVCN